MAFALRTLTRRPRQLFRSHLRDRVPNYPFENRKSVLANVLTRTLTEAALDEGSFEQGGLP